MAKAKQVEQQLITLTKEQFQTLLTVKELLDSATDTLQEIDGDSNLFEIGKAVGDAHNNLIRAYHDLYDIVIDKQTDAFEDDDN